jgi:hypothetical protein
MQSRMGEEGVSGLPWGEGFGKGDFGRLKEIDQPNCGSAESIFPPPKEDMP